MANFCNELLAVMRPGLIIVTQGPIYSLEYLECGASVTSAAYCKMLKRGLKSAICSKRTGRLSLKCVVMEIPAQSRFGAI